jgi:hypothetical protein
MSAFGDAMGAIRSVLIMQTNLERMDRDIDRLGSDVAGVRDAVASVDRRVTRIVGVMEGVERASAGSRRPQLPQA